MLAEPLSGQRGLQPRGHSPPNRNFLMAWGNNDTEIKGNSVCSKESAKYLLHISPIAWFRSSEICIVFSLSSGQSLSGSGRHSRFPHHQWLALKRRFHSSTKICVDRIWRTAENKQVCSLGTSGWSHSFQKFLGEFVGKPVLRIELLEILFQVL